MTPTPWQRAGRPLMRSSCPAQTGPTAAAVVVVVVGILHYVLSLHKFISRRASVGRRRRIAWDWWRPGETTDRPAGRDSTRVTTSSAVPAARPVLLGPPKQPATLLSRRPRSSEGRTPSGVKSKVYGYSSSQSNLPLRHHPGVLGRIKTGAGPFARYVIKKY